MHVHLATAGRRIQPLPRKLPDTGLHSVTAPLKSLSIQLSNRYEIGIRKEQRSGYVKACYSSRERKVESKLGATGCRRPTLEAEIIMEESMISFQKYNKNTTLLTEFTGEKLCDGNKLRLKYV